MSWWGFPSHSKSASTLVNSPRPADVHPELRPSAGQRGDRRAGGHGDGRGQFLKEPSRVEVAGGQPAELV